jgi:transcriptional regulator with XRE-family HTH domain
MARKSTAVDANVTLIRGLLKQKKLTVSKAASKINVTREHLLRVLNSHLPMSATLLKKLAQLLGTSRERLATGTDKILLNKLNELSLYFAGLKPEKLLGTEMKAKDVRLFFDVLHRFGIIEEANTHEININVNVAEAKDADLLDEGDEPDCEVE